MRQWNWVKIAGRGKLGDTNWGADFSRPLEELQSELVELRKHADEVVLLTGGGGNGARLAVLKDSFLATVGTEEEPKYTIQVMLENLTPVLSSKDNKFDPYIDSWQISVVVGV